MRTICLCLLFAFVLVIVAACQPTPTPPRTRLPLPTPVPTKAIGSVSRVQDRVEYGHADESLRVLSGETHLYGDDLIGVKEGGEALLDFGNAMQVTLFSNSEMQVSMRAAEEVPLIVHFFLWRGGLLGEKALDDERQVQIETPAGATVTVAGTTFFVTYDPNSRVTTVGNFDGTVMILNNGERRTELGGTYVMVEPSRPLGTARELALDAASFAQRARALNSPLAVVEELKGGPPPTARPTATTTPTPSPTNTPTATPGVPMVRFIYDTNCRSGPDLIYEVLRVYHPGDRLLITGRNDDASWWQVDAGDFLCWAADSVIEVENGDLVTPVPTPLPPTFTPTPTPVPPGEPPPPRYTGEPPPPAVTVETSTPSPPPPPPPAGCGTCDYDAYNCDNFSMQSQAQACFNYCNEQVGYDVHGLDDGDGVACESLP